MKNSKIGMKSIPATRASYQHISTRIANRAIRPMRETESFGKRLFFARMKLNLSRKAFAEFCTMYQIEGDSTKITAADVFNYEHEKYVAKTNKQALIEKALSIGSDYFEGSTSKKYLFAIAKARVKAFNEAKAKMKKSK